jgi:fluoroquinolone resistance protein
MLAYDFMKEEYTEGQRFTGINFSEKGLPKGEYENCDFDACVFLSADLTDVNFVECSFTNCDLSMANINRTAFKEVTFTACKMLGLRFENCNKFLLAMRFDGCQLNLSSFYQLSLKNTSFQNCSLHEADFAETDLTNATFSNCDLAGAIFDNTILEKADLRTAYNYAIDPEKNQIRKAKFSLPEAISLLQKYDIAVS